MENKDLVSGADDRTTMTSKSLMETAELAGTTQSRGVEVAGVEVTDVETAGVGVVAGVEVASVEVVSVVENVTLYKESTPKRSRKRKMPHLNCDGSQKDIPAGKRVLLSPSKSKVHKWQRYKKPTNPKLYRSKARHVSPKTSQPSKNVTSPTSTQSCDTEQSTGCRQVETERVIRTDVTQPVTSESVLSCANEGKQNNDQHSQAGQSAGSGGSMGEKEDMSATVGAALSSETESHQPQSSETLDVLLRIDDGENVQCSETGLCHLKKLTEELSQLGRDSATLVTARQSRKTKKRKQKSDDYVPSQHPVKRTSSPIRNVKQQPNCDLREAAFAEELGLVASHSKDGNVGSVVPGSPPQGDTEGCTFVSREIENIDENLEEKSKRFLLTAKNVRSIVHELVTNEQVLAMMCNTLQEGDINNQPQQIVYEPKMTRSKVKEVLEMGRLPSPWILSPIKGSNKDADTEPHFLEMTFSENDEDEEYKPSEDELKAYSEVGTPAPLLSTSQGEGTVDSSFGQSDEDSQMGASETATIAWRTRSKLPLQDTPLEQIELGFVAPDISADMYDTYCDDTNWKNFLCSIVKSDGRQDVNDSLDDEADPEYNFLAEVEKEEVDAEDFRTDKDVRVTKKELHELMDELFEAYGAGHEQPPNLKAAKDTAKTKKQKGNKDDCSEETGPQLKFVGDLVSVKGVKSTFDSSQDTDAVPLLTDEEKVQIQDQMRKHVQLLTQTYVQAASRPELAELSDLARLFLMELKALGDKTNMAPGKTSFFHSCNLPAALDVVSRPLPDPDDACNENLKQLMVANYVPKNVYEVYGLNYEQMEIFMTSPVFMFPQMLPECRLLQVEHHDKKRVLFSQAEDNLLAMGIDQFGRLVNKYAYIEQYMLPTKKKQQLRYRLKNLKADRTTGENLMKYLSKHNELPEFPRYLELEDPSEVVPPQDRDPDLLPVWCTAFRAARLNHQSNCQSALTGVTGWVQVMSVEPSTGSTPKKEVTLPQKKKPPAHSRQPSSRKVGVSGLNRFRIGKNKKITSSVSSPMPPSVSAPTNTTASLDTLGTDTAVLPVSDSQENAPTDMHTPCKMKPDVVINAAVLSPGSLVGGAAVKMATMLRPGFPATSPTVSSPGLDEPLIMLTARQLSQLGVKINMVPSGSDTTVQLSSPSGKGTLVSVGSGMARNTLLSSAQDRAVDSESEMLTSVALTSVTLSTSTTTTRCSSVVSPSQGDDTCVTRLGDSVLANVDQMSGDTVNTTHSGDANMTDAVDVTSVDIHHHDSTAADVELSVTAGVSLPVNSPVTVSIADTIEKVVDTITNITGEATTVNKPVDSSGDTKKSGISTDVVSPQVLPRVIAALTDSQNRTPQKIPSTPCPQKTSPSKRSLFYNSPSRKSTVFHRLHKLQDEAPKPRRNIDILPYPPLSMPDFSAGSPFYQSPSKQITFIQPSGGSTGFAGADISVSRNLAFSLHSPSKTGVVGNRRGHAVYISPVKKAAAKITARLKKVRKNRKLERILPKPAETAVVLTPVHAPLIVETERCKTPVSVGDVGSGDTELARFNIDAPGKKVDSPRRPHTEPVNPREEVVAMESESDGESVKGAASRPESATEFDDDDNDDEDHLVQLMAASTTIRFAPKLPLSETDICLTKAKKKRAVLLELLVPDLLAKDPLRDERDTAFAQAYLTTAKDVLLGNNRADVYEQLLKLLHDFGQSDKSPVELYQQLQTVLADFPELVQEFVVFLLPEQAKECDCFMENLESQHARTFLRKLEVHLRKHPSHLQKIINIFLQWQSSQVNSDVNRDVSQLKEAIRPLLRGQQHLLEEFCWFFSDEQPPQSSLTEFEEVTLRDSEDEDVEVDDYEEVQLPEGDELLGTQWCKCQCHQSDVLLYHRRKKHCRACRSSSIKIIKGRIYVQTSESTLKPARVVFHSPEKARVDAAHTDTRSTQPQARSKEEAAMVELSGEDAGRLTQASSARPSEHAQKDSRLRTPTCARGDTVKVPRMDSRLGGSVGEGETDVAGHIVSDCGDPPVAGIQAAGGTVSETLANTHQGSGGTNCGRDVVVHNVEAGKLTEGSQSGVGGPALAECTWTKEEDKHILESCKQHGLGGNTFQTVAAALKKSAESVSKRFYELMQLFNEQPSDPSENDSDNESDGSPVG